MSIDFVEVDLDYKSIRDANVRDQLIVIVTAEVVKEMAARQQFIPDRTAQTIMDVVNAIMEKRG